LMYASCTLRAHRKDRPRNMTTSGERGRYITRLREKARQERSCSLPLISPKTHRVPFALTKSTLLGTGATLVSAKGTRGRGNCVEPRLAEVGSASQCLSMPSDVPNAALLRSNHRICRSGLAQARLGATLLRADRCLRVFGRFEATFKDAQSG